MYNDKIPQLFCKNALPYMFGILVNSIYIIVDGIFIGQRLGTEALAAAAIAVPLVEILIATSLMVTSGAGTYISHQFGMQEEGKARQDFNLAFRLILCLGLLVSFLGKRFPEPLARLLGAPEALLPLTMEYMSYILDFTPFLLLSFFLSGLVRNDGYPRLAMMSMVIGSLSNILLDYLFLYPLDMGLGGAALATALGPLFSVLILLPQFLKKRGRLYFERLHSNKRASFHRGLQILHMGLPAFVMEFSIGMLTFLYNWAIVRYGYGEQGLAVFAINGYLMLLILTFFLGMAAGLQPLFSYFLGAKEIQKSSDLLRLSRIIFLITGLLAYLLVCWKGKLFVLLFAPHDPALASYTRKHLPLFFWGFILSGLNILQISYDQAIQQAGSALLLSLLRSLLLPSLGLLLLPLFFGREIIWPVLSITEALSLIYVLFKQKQRKRATM